ncbi:MAG TPA: SUMF1/EgtB/PvdO family nonheme iron enzyme [Blastocatellia bacterium]|nr:SUMF1/EgtB/PvdO family nonheme iron enzyme [Blastocatellia bacterium]
MTQYSLQTEGLPEDLPEGLMDLAEELRLAGYDIGAERNIAAQDLVIALAAHGRLPKEPRELRTLLAPIFCSSPTEQDEFYRRFEGWLDRRQGSKGRSKPSPDPSPWKKAGRLRRLRFPRISKALAATGVLLLLSTSAAAYLFSQSTLTLTGTIRSSEEGKGLPGAQIYFGDSPSPIKTDENGKYSIIYKVKRLDRIRGKISKYFRVAHPEHFPHQKDIEGDPPELHNITLQKRAGGAISKPLTGTGPVTAPPSPAATPIVEDKPLISAALRRLLLSTLPLAVFALWFARRRWGRRMLLEKMQSASAPHQDRIVVKGSAERLYRGLGIRRAIHSLRLHRRVDVRELDVPGAVRETIRQAGMFAPVYGARKTLPEYLLLIERASPHDEQARLGDTIFQRLDDGGVFVDRYYFQYDPRTCRRLEANSPTITLNDLAARHPDHRLLIFGDGTGLISPLTGEPEHWIESFAPWTHRALLTPEPPENWGYREEAIRENDFILLHATEDGLVALAETINAGVATKPNGHDGFGPLPELIAERPRRWIERQAPSPDAADKLCKDLRDYLGEQDWLWLCASAIYPAILWEITLYLGSELPGERGDFEARLMRLVRLPWFRYGTMPDWLRMRLIASFTRKQQRAVRRIITDMLLSALDQPKDGNKLDIARREEQAKPGLFEKIRQWRRRDRAARIIEITPEESPLRDYVFLGFLSWRKINPLSVGLPSLLRQIFFPCGETIFGPRPALVLLLALSISTLIWILMGKPKNPVPSTSLPLRAFTYETVTIDASGNEISRRRLQGQAYVEDLGGGVTIEMVAVPGGQFQMGSTDAEAQAAFEEAKHYYLDSRREWYIAETPRHLVKISPFLIGKFEVTQRQWRAVAKLPKVTLDLESDPSRIKGDDLPVENISWNHAKEFIARLNARLGLNEVNGYRLPSEAEWEYAARAGSDTPFAFGATINSYIVNYNGNNPFGQAQKGPYDGRTVRVGSLGVANAWGIFDMPGNVWEWCEDIYHNNYQEAPGDGRAWLGESRTGSGRVYRGGGWIGYAVNCRSASRYYDAPGTSGDNLGFRLLRVGR